MRYASTLLNQLYRNACSLVLHDDSETEEAVNAISLFFYHAEIEFPRLFDAQFETWSLKATDRELLEYAAQLINEKGGEQ